MLQMAREAAAVEIDSDKDYDPYEHRVVRRPTSFFDSFIHIMKGSIGSGILAMPMAFKYSGLYYGIGLTIMVALIVSYCIHLLVSTSYEICKRMKVPQLSFGEIPEKAFLCGPARLKRLGPVVRVIATIFLFLDLFGLCSIYAIFFGSCIKFMVKEFQDKDWNIRACVIWAMPAFGVLSFMWELKRLTYVSLTANILMILGLLIAIAQMIMEPFHYTGSLPPIQDPIKWPHFIGVVIFAMEAIAVVLPVESQMKNPRGFLAPLGVVNLALGTTATFYVVIGFLGYYKFGPHTADTLTMSLPLHNNLSITVQILIAVAILLTYAIQFYALFSLLRENIPNMKMRSNVALRMALPFGIVVFASLFPNLGPFMTLVGALCLSMVGLILPPLLQTVVFWNDPGMGKFYWRLWKNLFFIIFGFVAMISGTYVAIKEFQAEYTHIETVKLSANTTYPFDIIIP